MSGVRIDVGAVWTSAHQFVVNYGGAGDVTLAPRTLSTPKALHATDIKQHIHERLQTVNAALSCTESRGVFTIASSGSTFNINFGATSLKTILGCAASASGVSSHATTGISPNVFLGSRPAMITSGTRWHTRRTSIHRGRGRSIKVLKERFWRVEMRVASGEKTQFDLVARRILQGQPFSIFQDTDDMSAAWGYTAPTKNLKGLMLDASQAVFAYEPIGSPYHGEYAVAFDCVEYS